MNSKKHCKPGTIILGGGITGLSAGYISRLPIYEAKDVAGGICTSYYVRKGQTKKTFVAPSDGEAYHFEIGGGHWVFGGDPTIVKFISRLSPVKRYARTSAIYLADTDTLVPYPIQNNLHALDKVTAKKALSEMTGKNIAPVKIVTMADWMEASFGKTLCRLFFFPFHDLYTAKLYRTIAPQDAHKSPIKKADVVNGFNGKPPAEVGYNHTFIYPEKGLDHLMRKLAEKCKINYDKRAVKIDTAKKIVHFSDKSSVAYENIISTLPLNRMAELAGLKLEEKAHPSPSVLVMNIGAVKGPKCPAEQWIYLPKTQSGFHRVGFYNNVDVMFLPKSHRHKNDRVSVYVEKAYPQGTNLTEKQIDDLKKGIIEELQEWGWIKEVEVCDPTWIETAYTWSWPNSAWKEKALRKLEEHGIYQIGRYGRWVFQGIADSIKDGLMIGGAFS